METKMYDAVVVGSGQGGSPLARALGEAGWKTALVERDQVGGTCINYGCTPTKTMVASARVAYLARRAGDFGVRTGPVGVDMVAVRKRKRDTVESFRAGSERRIERAPNVDLIRGEARFTAPRELAVSLPGGDRLSLTAGKVIVINTGTRPAEPPIPGLRGVKYLDSTTIMELDAVPEHLLVLGGGYVGLEFAQIFRRFGSRVTVVHRGGQLLRREDREVAEGVAEILREDGVAVRLEATLERVEQAGDGIRAVVRSAAGEEVVRCSHLLVAAGRVPNTENLNLAAAGVKTDEKGFVVVDERLRTQAPGVYAIGDVNGGPAFTHISYDDFRILSANLLHGADASTKGRLLPYVVYVDPQLGRVGLSEEEARRQGRSIKVAKMPMRHVARALETSETRGLMKVVVDAGSDLILGAAVLGAEGGEMMSMLQLAMMGSLPYTALRDAIFAHPTWAESLNNLFASLDK